MKKTTQAELAAVVEGLRAEVEALRLRIAALEAGTAGFPDAPPRGEVAEREAPATAQVAAAAAAPVAPPAPQEEALTEEVLLAISAAIAAFLGKKPHIRQIRLIGSGAWAQQGRVSIQASHALAVRHE